MITLALWSFAAFLATCPPVFVGVCWFVGQPVWPFVRYGRGRKPKEAPPWG